MENLFTRTLIWGSMLCTLVLANTPLQLLEQKPLYDENELVKPNYIIPEFRLPGNLIPSHYDIRINPVISEGPNQFKASGSIVIHVSCVADTNSVVVHAHLLDVDRNTIQIKRVRDGYIVPLSDPAIGNREFQILTIFLGEILTAGEDYEISMDYVARIGGDERVLGMYHRSYTKPNGTEKTIVMTKLEAIGLRMIMPCFDEPQMKATFDISIAHTAEYHTLCNMPKVAENVPDDEDPDLFWDEYETSVKMSTYLLTIIVSDFDSVDATDGLFHATVTTWATPENIANGGGSYSADDTARCLAHFEELYGQVYPLPKMDSVALPGYGSSAMEQWGLMTYRENLLLLYEGKTTELERRRISEVIAHEVAHQWFGNLVTMAWWDDLWLNEGFATHVEKVGLHFLHKEFKSDHLIVSDDRIRAMLRDSQNNSLPVHYDGDNLGQIVYSKASLLIRMMEAFIGDQYDVGIRNYLDARKWDNAVQDDLFTSFDALITLPDGLTVKTVMDTWTRQTGYPLIRVSKASNDMVFVSQERFGHSNYMMDVNVLNPREYWEVPISFYSSQNSAPNRKLQEPTNWLRKDRALSNFEVDTTKWVVFNADAAFYYRTLYDSSLFKLIVDQLNSPSEGFRDIRMDNRAILIDDYFKSAAEGYITVEEAFELTQYLHKEDELVVWDSVFANLRPIFEILNAHQNQTFSEYMRHKVEGALTLIGFRQPQSEKGANVLLRASLLDWDCSMNSVICNTYANELITAWESTGTDPVPIDLRPSMYCGIVKIRGNYFKIVTEYMAETDLKRKMELRNSLACVTDTNDIKTMLNWAVNDENVLPQLEGLEVLTRFMANTDARTDTFETLKNDLSKIIERFHLQGVEQIVRSYSTYASEAHYHTQLQDFIDANNEELESIRDSLIESLNIIQSNIEWVASEGMRINNWILTNS